MKYKRFNKIITQYKYYKTKELSKLQFFSLIQSFLHKNLKGLVLHKAYLSQGLTPKYSLRNYCIFSGRSSGLYRKFNTSRIKLRDLSFSRMFTGLRKISW